MSYDLIAFPRACARFSWEAVSIDARLSFSRSFLIRRCSGVSADRTTGEPFWPGLPDPDGDDWPGDCSPWWDWVLVPCISSVLIKW
jgi:hypothetical protein